MIQPLRRFHLRTFLILAIVVPLIFVLALVKRRPLAPVTPVQTTAPSEVSR